MLMIVLTAVAVVWGGAALMVVAVCRSAARGDRTRMPAPVASAPLRRRSALRLIA